MGLLAIFFEGEKAEGDEKTKRIKGADGGGWAREKSPVPAGEKSLEWRLLSNRANNDLSTRRQPSKIRRNDRGVLPVPEFQEDWAKTSHLDIVVGRNLRPNYFAIIREEGRLDREELLRIRRG